MNLPTPSIFAIRSVRQYRNRDVVPYLALRYYLANRATRRERWAAEVPISLIIQRASAPYFSVQHFKERDSAGTVRHRDLYLPGANEALAEAVLLAECSKHAAFDPLPCVYSYSLSKEGELDGVFQPYFKGLQTRHQAIANACRLNKGAIVRYADVRAFYPSIPPEQAMKAWSSMCRQTKISPSMEELGNQILTSHFALRPRGRKELLTGPMFSHLIGNLVLRDLDRTMSAISSISYFRYVDDIVLVGSPSAVNLAYAEAGRRLSDLGLELHNEASSKHLIVDSSAWLRGEYDFRDSKQQFHWKELIGRLKILLTGNPEQHLHIQAALRQAGFRLPIPDYRGAIREKFYADRLMKLWTQPWFRSRERKPNISTLIHEAKLLKERYYQESQKLLETLQVAVGYERKRALPKLRYRAGRLAYLAAPEQLVMLADQLMEVSELQFQAVVLKGIATGNVTEVIRLGANTAQAVAQPLRAAGGSAFVDKTPMSAVEWHGVAVLALNGVSISGLKEEDGEQHEFLRIARHGVALDDMRSPDPFVREFASLHGVGSPRHAGMLDTAFDPEDDSVFDAVSLMVSSDSD